MYVHQECWRYASNWVKSVLWLRGFVLRSSEYDTTKECHPDLQSHYPVMDMVHTCIPRMWSCSINKCTTPCSKYPAVQSRWLRIGCAGIYSREATPVNLIGLEWLSMTRQGLMYHLRAHALGKAQGRTKRPIVYLFRDRDCPICSVLDGLNSPNTICL